MNDGGYKHFYYKVDCSGTAERQALFKKAVKRIDSVEAVSAEVYELCKNTKKLANRQMCNS
jgi:hypothetical protein